MNKPLKRASMTLSFATAPVELYHACVRARSLEFDRRLEMQQASLEKSRQLPEDLLRREIRSIAVDGTNWRIGFIMLDGTFRNRPVRRHPILARKTAKPKMQSGFTSGGGRSARGRSTAARKTPLAILLPLLSRDVMQAVRQPPQSITSHGLDSGESRTFEPFTVSSGPCGIHQQPSVNTVILKFHQRRNMRSDVAAIQWQLRKLPSKNMGCGNMSPIRESFGNGNVSAMMPLPCDALRK
ncbi:MAG: hypothetical protein U0894_19770 [Pirellulales bacterium]